jgi:chemotaxis protein CheD
MYRHFNSKFQKNVTILHPGEYYASSEDEIISTVLGSCIAVALYDPMKRVGGLNHFMLPGALDDNGKLMSETGKYGVFAMEFLINELMKLGSKRQDLVAKVFGGGHVLRGSELHVSRVPEGNIEFAYTYLNTEKITVESADVGGTTARKIFFYPQTFKVLLKRITGTLITSVEHEEEEYLRKLREERAKKHSATFF